LDSNTSGPLRAIFSSDGLPAGLDGRARCRHWHDIYCAHFGEIDMAAPADRPFSAQFEFMQIGEIGLTRFDVTVAHWARTKGQAADGRDDFLVGFNRSATALRYALAGRDAVVVPGNAIFYTNGESGESWSNGASTIVGLCLPRARVVDLVGGAEDMIGTMLTPDPAARHLGRYIEFLLNSSDIGESPPQGASIETLLLDLVALALGAGRDVAEVARSRGLRAARIHEILTHINAGFANPAFGPGTLAAKLGHSPRYIQALLQDTGSSFTQRVLELRLQKARALLQSRRHNRLKVSDIALASGFGNVSYFNQAFRRRFGCSPTQYRCGNGEAG
jgi:AraC-like DNA-binding protein